MAIRRSFCAAVGVLTAALAVSAPAQVTRSGNGYLFRVKLTAGSTIRYTSVISTSLSGHIGAFSMPMTRKVSKVRKNIGDLVVIQGPLQFNGKPVGQKSTQKMSIDRLGRVVGGSGNSGVTKFPEKPIRPGFVWTASLPIGMAAVSGDTANILAAYRFLKMTTYHGQKAAELSVSITKPGGRIPITGNGTLYILASDGNILHSTMKFSIQAQKDMEPASVTAEVTRG